MDRYKVLEMIGEGSFGRVFRATERSSGNTVALKLIPKVGHSDREISALRSEFKIQKQLKHPNIVRLLDGFETDQELISVAEYIPGELYRLFDQYKLDMGYRRLPEERVQEICGDLLSALYYLHSNRILHRDIKPQNILLDSEGRAKLCDFGFARNLGINTLVLTSIKGTPLYMAPELIEEKPYDHTADIWSLGCIVYELLVGKPPFSSTSLFQLIRKIRYESIQWPAHLSAEGRGFLQGVLEKESRKRLSWPLLADHPFIQGRVQIEPGTAGAPLTSHLSESQELAKEIQRQDKSKLLSGNSETLIRVAQKHEMAKQKQKLVTFQRGNHNPLEPGRNFQSKTRRFSDVGQDASRILLGRHNAKLLNRRMSEAILPSMVGAKYLQPSQPLSFVVHPFLATTSNSQAAGNFLPSTGQAAGNYLPSTGQAAGNFLPSTGQAVGNFLPSTGQAVGNFLPSTGHAGGNFLPSTGQAAGNFLPSTGIAVGNFQPSTGQAAGNFLPSTGQAASNFQPSTGQAAGSFLPSNSQAAGNFLPSTGQPATNFLPTFSQHTHKFLQATAQHPGKYLPAVGQPTDNLLPDAHQPIANMLPTSGHQIGSFLSPAGQPRGIYLPPTTVPTLNYFPNSNILAGHPHFQTKDQHSKYDDKYKVGQAQHLPADYLKANTHQYTGDGGAVPGSATQYITTAVPVVSTAHFFSSAQPTLNSSIVPHYQPTKLTSTKESLVPCTQGPLPTSCFQGSNIQVAPSSHGQTNQQSFCTNALNPPVPTYTSAPSVQAPTYINASTKPIPTTSSQAAAKCNLPNKGLGPDLKTLKTFKFKPETCEDMIQTDAPVEDRSSMLKEMEGEAKGEPSVEEEEVEVSKAELQQTKQANTSGPVTGEITRSLVAEMLTLESFRNLSVDSNETIKNIAEEGSGDLEETSEWADFLDSQLQDLLESEHNTVSIMLNPSYIEMVLSPLRASAPPSSDIVKKIVQLTIIPLQISSPKTQEHLMYLAALFNVRAHAIFIQYLHNAGQSVDEDVVKLILCLLTTLVYTSSATTTSGNNNNNSINFAADISAILPVDFFAELLNKQDLDIQIGAISLLLKLVLHLPDARALRENTLADIIENEDDPELLEKTILCMACIKKKFPQFLNTKRIGNEIFSRKCKPLLLKMNAS